MIRRIIPRNNWKLIDFGSKSNEGCENFDDLIEIKELTDYNLVSGVDSEENPIGKKRKKASKKQKQPSKKKKKDDNEEVEEKPKIAKKAVASPSSISDRLDIIGEAETEIPIGKKRKKDSKKQKQPSKKIKRDDDEEVEEKPKIAKKGADMSKWDGLFVPPPVLRSLGEMDFCSPTPIQAMALPSAIRDRMDIIGAAETGSGKTLAFAIPLIHHILEDKANLQPAEQNDVKHLFALILTPTRELAMQIRDHFEAVLKYTDIKCVAVVGGMSVDKQNRLLKYQPEIVIATPGRLWELIQEHEPHLSKIKEIKYLVIDEADRMVEKGHFQELSQLLLLINDGSVQKSERQNFIFSATMTFVHSKPYRTNPKKKKKLKDITVKDKMELIASRVGIEGKPKIIDLTVGQKMTHGLRETRINCTNEEKDSYLFYFLKHHPGRTLVFANSKDCVRRIVSIFTLLKCSPLPLHADMHQRQRLKNLDKFKSNPNGLLMATDVAARGLDIPNIQHVIHYQVPRTTENYVHRSGRTARSDKDGLSIMIVGPEDVKDYRKIMQSLQKDDLPTFTVERNSLNSAKTRVKLACQVEKEEHQINKRKLNNNWFEQAAEEADIVLDRSELLIESDEDEDDSHRRSAKIEQLKSKKQQLNSLLKSLN